MALYKEDQKTTIHELLQTSDKKKKEVTDFYRSRAIFTVLPSDLSTYKVENHRGEEGVRVSTPAGKYIPAVYTTEINGEVVTLRYADNRKLVKGTVSEYEYTPSHIEIDNSGVLQLGKAHEELIFFLKHHPRNKSNKIYSGDKPKSLAPGENFFFQEFEGLKRASETLKKIKMFDAVKLRILGDANEEGKLTDEILRATAKRCVDSKMDHLFYDVYAQPIEEIQAELLRLADLETKKIDMMLSSWENEVEVVVREGIRKGLLNYDNEGKVWMYGYKGDTPSKIVHVSDTTDSVRFLITHLFSKDKDNYYSVLVKALGMKNVPADLV